MKRLLLAPLLFVLSSCSNDISVKTDLGEKYIVKDTAVTVIPFGLKDLVKTIKEDEYEILDRYSQCTYTHGFKKNTDYYPGLGFYRVGRYDLNVRPSAPKAPSTQFATVSQINK